MAVIVLDSKNFEKEAVNGNIPFIVDFWAEWCGPCQMMGPIFKSLSEEEAFKGRLKFGKVNVDEEEELAVRYGIQGIPCLVIMQNGTEVNRIVGLMPREALRQKIMQQIK